MNENRETDGLKQQAFDEIDKNRDRIIGLGMSVWNEPEEGFREYKTSEKVQNIFREMGLQYESGLAITGVKAVIDGAFPGPTVAILGELDGLANSDHPDADPETGVVHACGHHAQLAALAAAGYGLKRAAERLAGRIVLFAVPAEELINLDFRKTLRDEGKITFFSGKQELVRTGAFDDIDIAIMHHAAPDTEREMAYIQTMNAFAEKDVHYIGRAAHAGISPGQGINAVHAYHVALAAINAQRETFRDEDSVRVHGIMKKGGGSVNVVPAEAVVEMQVRAKTLDGLKDVNSKTDRALKAGALGIGAEVHIDTIPGYLPLKNDERLAECWRRNTVALLGPDTAVDRGHNGGCTDMGDISQLIPSIHPWMCGGFSGSLHGSDFTCINRNAAFLNQGKIMTGMVIDLLSDSASEAKEIIKHFTPGLKKKEYLELMNSLFNSEHYTPE